MDKIAKLKNKLKDVAGVGSNIPIPAKVVSIEGESCTIELHSGLHISDVKLKASINEASDYILIEPVVNSEVVVISLSEGIENLTIIKVDKIQKLKYKQGELQIETDADSQKILVKNAQTSLHDLMDKLAKIIKELKVHTPAGPSGTPLPPTILKIEEFEQLFNQLLKAN